MNKTTPLKVLHVTGAMNRAGTETMLMNILRKADRKKVQFDFISYSQNEADYDEEIRRLGGKVIKLSKPQSILELYQAIKKHGPYDAVHSHTLFHCGIVSLAAFLAGVKVRAAHAHTTSDDLDTYKKKLYRKTMRFIINSFSTNLLACSRGAGSYLFGEKKLASRKYSFFPNVIDHTKFLKPSAVAVNKFKLEYGLRNRVVIGHIGRFVEPKNHQFLLQVMKKIIEKYPAATLLLIGDGELKSQVEDLAKQYDIAEKVRFAGKRSDIPVMLHSMDVFVFPSLYEGLGLVLLEAQAGGVPCVVSEAIQPEADLNLGLVSRISLAAGAERWADAILNSIDQKERNVAKITDRFEMQEYTLDSAIPNLLRVYHYSEGETYEESVDRLL